MKDWGKVATDDLMWRLGQLCIFTILWFETERKMAAGVVLQMKHLVKVFLRDSVQYERI